MVARYLLTLHQNAKNVGYLPGTPIIDLTGRVPGALYALGGYTPKAFWLNSINPGSNRYAMRALLRIPCEDITKAWIIWEKNPPVRPLDPKILSPSGITFPDDFDTVAGTIYPSEFWKDKLYSRPQYLSKPNRDPKEALQVCLAARGKAS
jgi:hypothetical protein